MKFKSRPVKVEQPPIQSHLLYEEMIPAVPQVPLEVAVPSLPSCWAMSVRPAWVHVYNQELYTPVSLYIWDDKQPGGRTVVS